MVCLFCVDGLLEGVGLLVFAPILFDLYLFVSFFDQPIALLMDTNTGHVFEEEEQRWRGGLCFTDYSTD